MLRLTRLARTVLFPVLALLLAVPQSSAQEVAPSPGNGPSTRSIKVFPEGGVAQLTDLEYQIQTATWVQAGTELVLEDRSVVLAEDSLVVRLSVKRHWSGGSSSNVQLATVDQFGGIGVTTTMRGNVLTVAETQENGPAARSGLRAGDQIVAVNGASIKELSWDDAVKLMRGEVGTKVVISVRGEGEQSPLGYPITRELIVVSRPAEGSRARVAPFWLQDWSGKQYFETDAALSMQAWCYGANASRDDVFVGRVAFHGVPEKDGYDAVFEEYSSWQRRLELEREQSVARALSAAKRAVEEGDLYAAAGSYRDVLTRDPGNTEANRGLEALPGLRAAQQERDEKRRRDEEAALQEQERQKVIAEELLRAQEHLAAGDLDVADGLYRQVLETDPGNAEATSGLKAMPGLKAAQKEQLRLADVASGLKSARDAVAGGQLDTADTWYKFVLTKDPGNAEAKSGRGGAVHEAV